VTADLNLFFYQEVVMAAEASPVLSTFIVGVSVFVNCPPNAQTHPNGTQMRLSKDYYPKALLGFRLGVGCV
jgi:hypothetical protein